MFSRLIITCWCIFIFLSVQCYSQTSRYFVEFTDKNNTPYSTNQPEDFLSQRSIERREKQGISVLERDLPVDPVYLDAIENKGGTILYTSRWFNAAYIEIDTNFIDSVFALDFVSDGYETAKRSRSTLVNQKEAIKIAITKEKGQKTNFTSMIDYGVSESGMGLLGISDMHELGYTGDGVLIAILDGGFQNAGSVSYFSDLRTNGGIVSTYDFVDQEIDVYDDHQHGTSVMSLLAAYDEGTIVGTAYDADYILLRTEDAFSEKNSEMIYWVIAAEYADSIGADIITSSLGYNEFDDASNNFVYADLDGETTLITQGADIAAETGMLVITSAGNEGSSSWQKITAPADGDNVIAVGAVNSNGDYASFSSRGPSADGRVKPNVVAQGQGIGMGQSNGTTGVGNGTSLAAPQIAGLAAGLWQAFPDFSAMDIKELIEQSGSQYEHPDERLGYGIPNFLGAYNKGLTVKQGNVVLSTTKVFPNPFHGGNLYLILGPEEVGTSASVALVDAFGREVFSEEISAAALGNELSIDASELQEGLYFLMITTVNGTTMRRVVKI